MTISNSEQMAHLTSVKPERLIWLDDVRGLCMFFVIISHCHTVEVPILRHIYPPVYLCAFFLVSGYLFRGGEFKDSIRKIFKGLIVPYILLSLVSTFVSLTFIRSIRSHTVLPYLHNEGLKLLLGTKFWFIACIIVVQLLYSAIYAVFAKKQTCYKMITATIGLLSIFVIRRVENGSLPWSIDTAVYALGWFALGHWYKSYPNLKFKKKHMGKIISALMMILYIVIVLLIDWDSLHIKYDMANNRFDNPMLQLALSLFGCVSLVLFAQNYCFGKYFTLLGQNTLVAYIFHGSIGFALVGTLFKMCHLNFLQHYPYIYIFVFAFIVGCVMIGLSLFFNKFFPVFVGKRKIKKEMPRGTITK